MKTNVWMTALAIATLAACGGGSGGGTTTADGTGDHPSGGGERGEGPHGLHAGSHGSCMREAAGVCHEVLRTLTDEARAQARADCEGEAQGGRWSDGICPGGDAAIAWCGDSTNTWFYGPTANLSSAQAACPAHMHFYDLSEPASQSAVAPPLHERADGSCTTTSPARCTEYIVDPAQLASTGEACTAGQGTWATTPCATTGAVGHCGLAWFYGTVEEAQGFCSHGTEPFIPTAR
jgi:hypothetical protein